MGPESGRNGAPHWWNGPAYGQAWGGLGDLAGSLVLMASPVGWVAAGMAVTGNTGNGFSDFMYDRAVVLRNAGGALVGWDPGAEDGWHKWREDGVAAGTTSALNIATFFIPGAGEVAGGLKAGSIGARVVQIAGATSEFVVQGGSWVVRGGIRVVADLRVAVTRFSLDDLLASVRPRLVEDPVTGMRFPVFGGRGGLFTAMTAHTPDVPGPHPTSVGDGLFGGREGGSSSGGSGGSPTGPHLDEPAATADGPPQADHPSHADSPAHNDPRTDADTGSEHGGTGQERPAEVGDPSSSDGIPPKHEDDAAGSGSEDADGGTPTHHTTTPAVGAGSEPGWLEGQPDFAVRDPANPGREITDIDATEGHVLWEEKSATGATDIPRWVQKHIYGKFQRYMEARKYLPFYEDADIGFRFTTGGVQPQFREAVEQAIADLREQNPDVVIREDWSE